MTVKKTFLEVDLDGILKELGTFGKSQLIMYLWISGPILFTAMYYPNYIFTAADMEYRCFVPECENQSMDATLETDWLPRAMPSSSEPRRCFRYAPVSNSSDALDSCSADSFDTDSLVPCEQFVFGDGETIVKELGIQCEGWKRTLVGTFHSMGLLLALPIVGYVSDKYGRRIALVSSAFLAGILGLARSFASNYVTFLTFEILEPTLGSGVYSSGFILGMELVGPKRRVLGGTILCMFYSIGAILLGCIAWLIPNWRILLRIIYTPSLLFIAYYWIIHESVRWLISKGRYEKAVSILKRAAKVNGVTLTDKSMESLYTNVENQRNDTEELNPRTDEEITQVQRSPFNQVIHSPIILSRLMVCSFWWITCTFVYYGLSINSVSLSGNVYLNYILVSLVELPAYATGCFLLDRIGRKYTLSGAFFASGTACIVFPFLPKEIRWLSLLTYLFGKYFITIAFGSCYIYTSELFPTPLRHSLLGTCSMIGRIGSIVAPQTPLLAEYMASLPSLLFGGCSFISGLLMLTSPETLNIKLPDTIEEAENISRRKSPKNP